MRLHFTSTAVLHFGAPPLMELSLPYAARETVTPVGSALAPDQQLPHELGLADMNLARWSYTLQQNGTIDAGNLVLHLRVDQTTVLVPNVPTTTGGGMCAIDLWLTVPRDGGNSSMPIGCSDELSGRLDPGDYVLKMPVSWTGTVGSTATVHAGDLLRFELFANFAPGGPPSLYVLTGTEKDDSTIELPGLHEPKLVEQLVAHVAPNQG